MSKPRHKEHIKADIREIHGSLVAFEVKRGLPAGSVKDVLRQRSVAQTERAIADELSEPLHILFPWRYEPLPAGPSTKEDSKKLAPSASSNPKGCLDMAQTDATPAVITEGRGPRTNGTVPGEFLLPVARINLSNRLRPIQQAAVDDLKVALQEGPLAHPITVRPTNDGYELVIGAHRLTAFIQMGRSTIPVIIRTMTNLEARQLEIDENLVRAELNALDRLTFLAERVEVWAERNPDKVVMDATQPIKLRGRPPKAFLKLRKVDGYVPALMGFVAETARDTGLSRQGVYRAVQALAALPLEQRDRFHGTWIAKNDAALRQIAGIAEADEQAAVIDLLLAGKTKSIPEARALAAGHVIAPKGPSDTVQRDFEKAWKAATPSQRDGLLHWLSGQKLPAGWDVLKAGGQA